MTAAPQPLVLIDTSAWVEVLRNNADPALRNAIEVALQENRAAMTGAVWVELYRGVRGKRELESLGSIRRLCHWLAFDDLCWDLASTIARRCHERGVNVPLGDVLIAACATHHKAELIESDKHFKLIASAMK